MVIKVAILVDGGFYRKRAKKLWGEKTPGQRAKELEEYCKKHLSRINLTTIIYIEFFIMIVPHQINKCTIRF